MKRHRVHKTPVRLDHLDPGATPACSSKSKARQRLEDLRGRLDARQELLWLNQGPRVLVVLQGMDTAGKDGVIRRVFEGVNPQGVRVASFKVPSAEELAHDFLWRIHAQVPGAGEITIFNRSHYEDVLVVRVHDLVPKAVWEKRYEQINAFEKILAENGTVILKFFLHISKEEQRERLQARIDDPTKRWKFRRGDLDERERWDDYMAAYEDVLTRTSTEWAPWHVVPADKKWYRDLVVSTTLVDVLEELELGYPTPEGDLEGLIVR